MISPDVQTVRDAAEPGCETMCKHTKHPLLLSPSSNLMPKTSLAPPPVHHNLIPRKISDRLHLITDGFIEFFTMIGSIAFALYYLWVLNASKQAIRTTM